MGTSHLRETGRGFFFFSLVSFIAWGGLTVFLVLYVFHHVNLKPKVDENFFFSSDDPQFKEHVLISKTFLQEQQVILSIGGNIYSSVYLRRVGELTAALSEVPQVDSVQSLTRGPKNTDDALKSPLWKRFLFSNDKKASFVYVFLKQNVSTEEAVLRIEKIRNRCESPDFPIMISGAPYIVELISRNLLRDLKVFSVVAFCVFGLSGLLISRSVAMVLGTLIACTNSSAITLILTHKFGIAIGPLTANLSTIVFVLTLTHMVFMTFNWRHIIREKETDVGGAWLQAVRVTLLPSFWSMLTALLGFISLLSVPATPLRQLGLSGAIGTVVAFTSAYLIYPFFLRMQKPGTSENEEAGSETSKCHLFFKNRNSRVVAGVLLATVIASIGLWKLDTNPTLFSYFKRGGELRNSLEYIDRNGGSTPLNIVLRNPSGTPLKISEDYQKLWRLQDTLESDPAVGSVMSLPLLLAEAKRKPLVSLIPIDWLMKLLERPIFGKAAIYYITKDHTSTLFVLRMKESYRQSDHMKNVERLKSTIRKQGFDPGLVGGTYLLFGKLSKLVVSSMVDGLTLLVLLFMVMGGIISHSLRIIGAMLISLAVIPLLMLGMLGHFHVPIDIISAPGANVAIGIGVDAMIHMLVWVRRHPAGSMVAWEGWADVRLRLWKPILYSMSVVCAGFGIFILSGFPPTQRFGLSVVLGTLMAPLPALFVLPWFATARFPGKISFSNKKKAGNRN